MTAPLLLRRYRPSDRATCLALFDGNTPSSFLPEERADYTGFLDRAPGTYLVVEDGSGRMVACGGVATRDGVANDLCWGMVDPSRHKEGIGRVLLRVRLALSCHTPGIQQVRMNTSNETAPFFEREGLRTVHVVPNFFRPGLHRHDMVCPLDPDTRAGIAARLAATLAEGHRVEPGLLPNT
jgi:GNAT superfamily N-acetyltransferase